MKITTRFLFFLLLACCQHAFSQARYTAWDSLALTPPMGWNSWNFFEARVSEQVIKDMADAMAANGMKAAGYQYLVIDDHWVGGRDKHNQLYPDPERFPHGMKYLADYVHGKGLKLGIYSDAAPLTCGGVTGSYNFEEEDARTFAGWGIDFLKYDYCNAPEDVTTAFARYARMGDALKKCGRPIVYSICEWGPRKPWLWARAAGGHLWRTTWDSRDVWESHNTNLTGMMEIFRQQENLAPYAGPGGWNDPDLLMVGLYGKGSSSSVDGRFKGCTTTEYRTHFALWCMLAAPLMVNMDLRTIDAETLRLLTNKQLIAINQDALGKQATTVLKRDSLQVLLKPLQGHAFAVCVFNTAASNAAFDIQLKKDLDLWQPFRIQEVWSGKNVSALKGTLAAHDCAVYILEEGQK
ncbi:glycoside hydrolase family 27 protein [Chitinophaga vietnamensis]|uniref:glycoside hydrolase family 27 protein n=1 Tax=Chitinophaga vietnamensis TaxID=2593957 RepID=UPI00117810DA|nr:glycoside hydrolase family 27 protein [Chitinophaga vietnamensis]